MIQCLQDEIEKWTKLSPETIARLVKKKIFPQPISTACGANAWDQLHVLEWMKKNKIYHFPTDAPQGPFKPFGESFVYFIRCEEFVKIGITGNVQKRFWQLQSGSPFELEIVRTERGRLLEELQLHQRFEHLRVRPNGEWFHLKDELRAYLEGT